MIDSALISTPTVANRLLRLEWANGRLSAEDCRGTTVFRNAGFYLERFDETRIPFSSLPDLEVVAGEDTVIFQAADQGLQMRLEYRLDGKTIRISARITNMGVSPAPLGDVALLSFDNLSETHLLSNPCDVFSLGASTGETGEIWALGAGNKRVFALRLDDAEPCYVTENMLALRPVQASGLAREVVYSFDRIAEAACGFSIDLKNRVACARVALRGATLAPGESRALPTLFVDVGLPVDQALEAAVDRISALYHPPVKDQVPTGWCSWYYYYERVTEADILSNLRFIAANRERFPWQVVQIDDGYQLHWGDWLLPGAKFAHDMAWLAREIRSQGFQPGIWVAPMIMSVPSNLFREHPEWALGDFQTGNAKTLKGWSPPEENPWVILDGTNPEYLGHIRKIFSVMAHEWGYEYFKIDATAFGAYAGRRFDPTKTGIQAVRMVMQAIRDAIGPDKFLLGCGLPFGSAVGIVNGERVSDDLSTAFQPGEGCCPVSVALPQSIHRSFLQGKWWHNDPDCVLVRSRGTPHNAGLAESGLSLDEARLLATVVGLTQGIQMVGENLLILEKDRLEILDALQPLMPVPARPLDLFSPKPERLLSVTGFGQVLALLNWTPQPNAVVLDPSGVGEGGSTVVYDVWSDTMVGVFKRRISRIEIPAQGVRLLVLRTSTERPSFLGFSGHVSGGTTLLEAEEWDVSSKTLRIVIAANRSGFLGVRVPNGWQPLEGCLTQRAGEHWAIPLPKGSHTLAFRFRVN